MKLTMKQVDANRARRKTQQGVNELKTPMKGKNRPSKKHRKKQLNVIEEKKPEQTKRMADEERRKFEGEARAKEARQVAAAEAPRALARFYK
jgi:U3 small nucleolar RNA-associated protein 7